MENYKEILTRLQAYLDTHVSTTISPADGMYSAGEDGALEQYMAVGRSAIYLIAQAMIGTGRTHFSRVLDLPCGGGRVSRHLKVFLPEAKLFVSDLNKDLQAFTVSTFSADAFEAPPHFDTPPSTHFDLVFVGSLLTHFDSPMFETAVGWFLEALAPDGVLILTTHGRRHEVIQREVLRYVSEESWTETGLSFRERGFGFVQTESILDRPYGFSLSAPSWLMRLVEQKPGIRIAGFQEAGWGAPSRCDRARKTRYNSFGGKGSRVNA